MPSSAAAIAPVAARPATIPAPASRPPWPAEPPVVISLMQVDDPCLITKHPPLIKLAVRWLLATEPRWGHLIITGEPGTGRRFFAHCLHQLGSHPERPLIEVDCASLLPDRAREVLFGGSVSGAIDQAQGGDLVLAHLDCLSVSLQDELATHLRIRPVYTPDGEMADPPFLLIGTTTCTEAETALTGLSSPALCRAFVVPEIHLPSLHERREDIPALASHFADQAARLCDRRLVHLTTDALALLQESDWPGNVGQLQRTIEHAVIRTSRNVLDASAFRNLPPVDELFLGFYHDPPALRCLPSPVTSTSAFSDQPSGSPRS